MKKFYYKAFADGAVRAAAVGLILNVLSLLIRTNRGEMLTQDQCLIFGVLLFVCLCLPAIALIEFRNDAVGFKIGRYFIISGTAFILIFIALLFTDNPIMPSREISNIEGLTALAVNVACLLLNCIGRFRVLGIMIVKKNLVYKKAC